MGCKGLVFDVTAGADFYGPTAGTSEGFVICVLCFVFGVTGRGLRVTGLEIESSGFWVFRFEG
jgi:hypothetical protein